MKLLLDTHTFIWWANNDPNLSVSARLAVGDRANEVFLSAVSTWEMAIRAALPKYTKGSITLNATVPEFVAAHIAEYHFRELLITYEHTYQVETMAMHHKDPFDRLLIAQAQLENLVLVTCDSEILHYDVETLW